MVETGKVINIISNIFYVEINNEIIKCTSRGIFKAKDIKPVVGDIVKVKKEDFTIIEVCERKSYIKRPKIANVSKIVLVVSANKPKPDLLMLDKQLAFAEYLNIEPIIIVNKVDLDHNVAEKIKEIYSAIGYKVILTNAKELKIDLSELNKELKNNINVFSGNSGVGKSTLINDLFNKEITEEGKISHKNKKGKNTTTSTKLYKLEENTYLADTPGFSTFDIYEIEYRNLYQYFKELSQYTNQCEYADCTHMKEMNCGIKLAIGKTISESRYNNYKKIYEELKDREEHKW